MGRGLVRALRAERRPSRPANVPERPAGAMHACADMGEWERALLGAPQKAVLLRRALRADTWQLAVVRRRRRRQCCPLRIPVIGSIARGTQRLNCSLRGSMEPRIEQSSLSSPRAMEQISGILQRTSRHAPACFQLIWEDTGRVCRRSLGPLLARPVSAVSCGILKTAARAVPADTTGGGRAFSKGIDTTA